MNKIGSPVATTTEFDEKFWSLKWWMRDELIKGFTGEAFKSQIDLIKLIDWRPTFFHYSRRFYILVGRVFFFHFSHASATRRKDTEPTSLKKDQRFPWRFLNLPQFQSRSLQRNSTHERWNNEDKLFLDLPEHLLGVHFRVARDNEYI